MDLRVEVQAATPRRLWALTRSLPPDSAFRRDGKAWTTEMELAAQGVEAVRGYLRLIAQSHGVKFKDQPPEPIKHPDRGTGHTSQSAKRRMSVAEFEEWFSKEVV